MDRCSRNTCVLAYIKAIGTSVVDRFSQVCNLLAKSRKLAYQQENPSANLVTMVHDHSAIQLISGPLYITGPRSRV